MVTLISFSDLRGGAAKAAFRIFNGIKKLGVDVEFVVAEKKSIGDDVQGPTFISEILHILLRVFSYALLKLMKTSNSAKHSLNLFSSPFVLKKALKTRFLHLHWINNDTVSIRSLAVLAQEKKVIITLHDEWMYCGAEHCYTLDGGKRFIDGYCKNNTDVSGVDLNNYIWNKKKINYINFNNVTFTVPSKWLYDRAKSSYLLCDKKIILIPNPIPVDIFRPKRNMSFNSINGIEKEDFVIVFGAVNLDNNPLKGGDLLYKALNILSNDLKGNRKEKVKLLIFGGDVFVGEIHGFKAIGLGSISTERQMSDVYNAGTVTVVPSLVESFGQVAAESLACSTPVIAFNSSGIKDIVKHKKSGFLAQPFKFESLAAGLLWFIHCNQEEIRTMGEFGRHYVEAKFSTDIVINKYKELYQEVFSVEN